jgi:CubicO group peptidase (beta-lactamase class C family)
MTTPDIEGFVAPGFERVSDAFRTNFDVEDEIGASFAVVQNGELIVDLWGGVADRAAARPWSRDTLQLIFSGTKGLVAIVMLMLVERREVDLDRSVRDYWPEFRAQDVLLRDVVSHQARLPGLEAPLSMDDLPDDRRIARMLASQTPSTDPRAAYCYHPLTYGWLCGEIVRRVTGVSIGTFFHEQIARPLELELWLGLSPSLDARVSRLEMVSGWGKAPFLDPAVWAHDPLIQSIWGNPACFDAAKFPWNGRSYHLSEIPGANAIGTARSIARLYGELVRTGGTIISPETLLLGRTTIIDAWDEIHGVRRRTGVGFQLQTDLRLLGPTDDAFGHDGAGGSNHGAWPSDRIGYSYVMNLMRDDPTGDRRAQRLLASLRASLN